MVKINTAEFRKQLNSRPTKTSVFIKFLIKICFLPINLDEGVIRFKLLSKKTLVHVVIYWGLYLLITSLDMSILTDDDVMSKIAEQNKLDTFSLLSLWVTNISILFPLFLCRGLNNMEIRMVWTEGLPFPKHGVTTILSHFMVVIGFFGATWAYITSLGIPGDTRDKLASVALLGRKCLSSGIEGWNLPLSPFNPRRKASCF